MEIKEEAMSDNEEEVADEKVPNLIFNYMSQNRSSTELVVDDFNFQIVRPIRVQLGLLTQPHGSVKLSAGKTVVICGVFGPTEMRISKELPHRGSVDVLFRPKITGHTVNCLGIDEEKHLESVVESILEGSIYLQDIPSLGYNLILHEYENDGCLLSTCINSAVVALLDGGSALRFTLAAVTTILTSSNQLIIDPSASQIKNGYEAMCTFVFSNDSRILYTSSIGKFSSKNLQKAMEESYKGAQEIFKFYHHLISQKTKQNGLNSVLNLTHFDKSSQNNESGWKKNSKKAAKKKLKKEKMSKKESSGESFEIISSNED